jgi:hypothetical protein
MSIENQVNKKFQELYMTMNQEMTNIARLAKKNNMDVDNYMSMSILFGARVLASMIGSMLVNNNMPENRIDDAINSLVSEASEVVKENAKALIVAYKAHQSTMQ